MSICKFNAKGSNWAINTEDIIAIQELTKIQGNKEITIHLISGNSISFDLKDHEKIFDKIMHEFQEKYQQVKTFLQDE